MEILVSLVNISLKELLIQLKKTKHYTKKEKSKIDQQLIN